MILRSRRWRLLIRMVALVITSVLMLAFAAPASYALQDDSPKLITHVEQLLDKERPVTDRYAYTGAVPDLKHIVTTHGIGTTYYWLVLPEYDNQLLVRAEGDNFDQFVQTYNRADELSRDAWPRRGDFYGKITNLKAQAGFEEVIDSLASEGIKVDKESAMVLLQGEQPRTYRPMVPVVGLLATFWALALVGLLRILRGGPRRRRIRNA